jgi:dTDP-4-dehydrorhamnose reductase
VRVLIAGAEGQLGRVLLRSAPADLEVRALGHAQLDIADLRCVERTITEVAPDVIVNAAAFTNVDGAETEARLARDVNTRGPQNLAFVAGRSSARLVHMSTDYVFDGRLSRPYLPECATNPLNVYGITKRDGESAVADLLPEESVILRTSWLYAASGRNFVRTMIALMSQRSSVGVVADQVGAPTAASSLAEAVWKIVRAPELHGTYHWTDAGVASWYDFAIAIAEEGANLGIIPSRIAVIPITSHQYATPARRPSYSVLDTTSLRSLGIDAAHWRTRLRAVLKEIRDG